MTFRPLLVAAAAAVLALPAAQANCYRVFDAGNVQLYSSQDSPVDLSRPLSQTVPARFGGGSALVFSPDGNDCPVMDLRTAGPAPVLDNASVRRDGGASSRGAPSTARGRR